MPSHPTQKRVRRPVSRVLSHTVPIGTTWGRPFLWDVRRRTPRATYPDDDPKAGLPHEGGASSLFGLAPGGACHASPVAGAAVRSYRTLSPLPRPRAEARGVRRFAFCGAIPGVAPAGRYPAPCLRGARTFLHRPEGRQRPSGRLTRAHHREPSQKRKRATPGMAPPLELPAWTVGPSPYAFPAESRSVRPLPARRNRRRRFLPADHAGRNPAPKRFRYSFRHRSRCSAFCGVCR